MKNRFGTLLFACAMVTAAVAFAAAAGIPPPWAFAVNPPGTQPPVDDGVPRHLPNSSAAFTITQVRDLFNVPDWHPDNHPSMPEIVAQGRKPGVFACGFCHLPNGLGRPENSSLAGLPADYIARQIADYRSGARKSSEPKFKPASNMVERECKATDQEVAVAAKYFSQLPSKRW